MAKDQSTFLVYCAMLNKFSNANRSSSALYLVTLGYFFNHAVGVYSVLQGRMPFIQKINTSDAVIELEDAVVELE